MAEYTPKKSYRDQQSTLVEHLCLHRYQGRQAGLPPQTCGNRFATSCLIVSLVCFLLTCPPLLIYTHADQSTLSSPKESEYRIAIHCARKVIQLWHHTELIREYPIEIGKTGTHKRQSGDHRTPIGDYEVSWMASRDSEKGHKIIDHKSWCKGNKFVYSPTGPALEKLWTNSYGGPYATIISLNYPNSKDRMRGFSGECIHIHADLKIKEGTLDTSYGCIHMFPMDAIELYELIDLGTPVKILP